MNMNEICYFCGEQKTSKEHVPPKVFFPNEKYSVDGKNHKSNLITVPSCNKHNSEKSHLDEYLFVIIAMNILNNEHGEHLAMTKLMSMVKRKKRVLRDLFGTYKPVLVKKSNSNEFEKTVSFEVDNNKLDSAFKHIAKALFFYHFAKNFEGDIKAYSEFLMYSGDDPVIANQHLENIREAFFTYSEILEKHGDNQEIFYYQVSPAYGVNHYLRLCFYENTVIDILLTEKTSS